jgi:hypothetical protein
MHQTRLPDKSWLRSENASNRMLPRTEHAVKRICRFRPNIRDTRFTITDPCDNIQERSSYYWHAATTMTEFYPLEPCTTTFANPNQYVEYAGVRADID